MHKKYELEITNSSTAYNRFTFDVSCDTENISIKHNISKELMFLVYMIVKDSDGNIRYRKYPGSGETFIKIGSTWDNTSIGAVPGKIPQGLWCIELYLATSYTSRLDKDKSTLLNIDVTDENLPIEQSVGRNIWTGTNGISLDRYDFNKNYNSRKGWYKGDLHTHTILSDGAETPENASRKAEMMDMDFYIPTEHNVLPTAWPETDVMIVPGTEITTHLGHANFFGVDKYPTAMDRILVSSKDSDVKTAVNDIVSEAKEKGWLISINHPFLYVWKWLIEETQLQNIDCLEIINDPTYAADKKADAETANRMAVDLSDTLWGDGWRICAIGGSDSHKKTDDWYDGADGPSIPGDPATWLYMDGLSPNNLLNALKKCNSYVTRFCTVDSNLLSNGRQIMFGDHINDATEIEYTLTLDNLQEEPVVFYIKNGQKYICNNVEKAGGKYMVKGTVDVDNTGYQWIRFGAEKKDGTFLFYANPVTKGAAEHKLHTFGQAKRKVEDKWK